MRNCTFWCFTSLLSFFFVAPQALLSQDLKLEKLSDAINTPDYDEICPVVSRDGSLLFFTRVGYPEFRKSLVLEGEDVADDEHYDFYLRDVFSRIAGRSISDPVRSSFNQDVWMSQAVDSLFDEVVHPDTPLNNALPNSICAITPVSGEYIVVNQFFEEGGMQKGFSLVRFMSDGSWTFPEPIHIKNYDTFSDGVNLTMSKDGKVLILSLNRSDSKGSNDLYVSFRTGPGQYSEPKNIGSDINTQFRETTPSLSDDMQVIYFSSNRHGRGGNDIYFSRRLSDDWTKWGLPRRFISPINSASDDSQSYFNAATGYLYFTSRRDGSSDIFRVQIRQPEPVKEVIVHGKVVNSETGEPIGAEVLRASVFGGEFRPFLKTGDGQFSFQVPVGTALQLKARKSGFLSHRAAIQITPDFYAQHNELVILLDPAQREKKITLNPIYFQRSTSSILKKSFPELNKLANIMLDYPYLCIRIEGHTDNQGTKQSLVKLSKERTQSVKDFLAEKGVRPERVGTHGFGGDRPVNDNGSEEKREQNRRVEVKITRF